MSIYNDLHSKYTEGWTLELQHWSDLEHVAARSRNDFASYLGIGTAATVRVDGQTLPIVELGFLDDKQKFQSCSASELPRVGRELHVVLRLNFQIDVDPPKKVQHVFSYVLIKENGLYEAIDRLGFENKRFPVPEFKGLFDYFLQGI
ncbi:TPA: hypothetical protein U8207_001728 [Pseudomonas putida]|nr:hypothetical protein [Pseudomonas putida]